MKRIVSLILIAMLIVSLSLAGFSCKAEEGTEETVTEETVAEEETAEEETAEEETAEEETSAIPELTDEPITIYATLIAGVSGEKWRKWAAFYMADHPNVTIESSEFALADLTVLLEPALTSGAEDMDLVWYQGGAFMNNWARNGLIKNLDMYYDYYGWAEKKLSIVQQYKVPDLGWYQVSDGGILAPVIYYNTDLFAELGLEIPTTLDEWFATLDKVKTTSEYIPIENSGNTRWQRLTAEYALRLMGRDKYEELLFWNEDPDRSAETAEIYRSPEIIEAITMSLEMNDKGYYPEGHLGMDANATVAAFINSEAVFYDNGVWATKTILENAPEGFNFGTLIMPGVNAGDPTPYTGQFSNGVCVPEYVSDEKMAVIADLINETTTNKRYLDETFYTESVFPASNFFTEAELNAILPAQQAELVARLNENDAVLLLDHWMHPEVLSYYNAMMPLVFTHELTPEEAAEGLYQAAVGSLD